MEQIPWHVEVGRVLLGTHQRLLTKVEVRVDLGKLQKRSVARELHLAVLLGDAASRWYPGGGYRRVRFTERVARRAEGVFTVPMFVRPGDHQLAVVLFDRVTGERSVTRRRLHVNPLSGDPLPDAELALPAVEFLPAEGAFDGAFLPSVQGRLNLAAATQRPVHVEVIANFSTSEQHTGSRAAHAYNRAILLPTLKVFSSLRLPNGSLTITGLDLDQQRVFFQQQHVRELDWPRLRESLATLRPDVVDVRTLQARTQRAAFFREVMTRRIQVPARRGMPTEPYRVFIVIGSGILFPPGSDRRPIALPEDCQCRVYYLRYFWWGNVWDEMYGLMKPLKPRRFDVQSPLDIRKALAHILEDLRAL